MFLVKWKVLKSEDTVHTISIGFAGGFTRLAKVSNFPHRSPFTVHGALGLSLPHFQKYTTPAQLNHHDPPDKTAAGGMVVCVVGLQSVASVSKAQVERDSP